MNHGDDEFSSSDAWLSEQLFAQLKDFNADYKDKVADMLHDSETKLDETHDLSKTRLESFEATFRQNGLPTNAIAAMPMPTTYDIHAEVLDLSCSSGSTMNRGNNNNMPVSPPTAALLDLSVTNTMATTTAAAVTHTQSTPALVAMHSSHTPIAEVAAVIDEAAQQTPVPFNVSEEELKLLKFLETQPLQNAFVDEKTAYMPTELPSTAYRIVKCANCNCLFDIITFQSHICDYDEQHNLIMPPVNVSATAANTPASSLVGTKPLKEDTTLMLLLLPVEPACIRLLRENQIRIRRFLKDELKYDVHATSITNSNNNISNGGSSSTNTNAGINACSVSVCSGNVGNASSSSNGNNNNNNTSSTSNNSGSGGATGNVAKKQEGPHECTLCERKFVHASGLLRHMEKHAMDLIPTPGQASISGGANGSKALSSGGSNAMQSVNGLRVVIKCTLCGRIFFEPLAAFSHLCAHFPDSEQQELELDNCAEIPYETYLDDAIHFLLAEAKTDMGNAVTAAYHEEKTLPQYLKMVILSCILQCEFCDLVFSEVSYLFVHSACHLPDRRFECFACDICMRTSKESCTHWQAECVFMRENLKVHQASTQRYFVCNVCENKFQSLDQLHEHRYTAYHFFPRMNKCLGALQLPCEYCEAIFENAHDCVLHYEDKHYKKYKRDKDGTGTSSKTRQYLCDICGKSYTQSSHLWQHLRFHQGVKPFACKEPGCTRKFTIRPDLNDHIRKCHTGERPYHCLVCGKRFLTGSVFYQHRLIHRGERRYECEECGKRFYRADALKNHQRIHTGEKPFGCLFCTKNFRQRGDRDKHIRARHSHLDANARLMMQMQKLQLEAAAAAAAAQLAQQQFNTNVITHAHTMAGAGSGAISNNGDGINYDTLDYGNGSGINGGYEQDGNDMVMIGNVAFPKSMFESLIPDIDEDTLKMHSNTYGN